MLIDDPQEFDWLQQMSIFAYSYLIGKTVALLNEKEWELTKPFAISRIERVRKYSDLHGRGLAEALEKEDLGQDLLNKYYELTGIRLNDPDQVSALQMSNYGSLCPECSKPFRSAKAKMCAACGYHLPYGQLAGPLSE